jgi:hypothetical protein
VVQPVQSIPASGDPIVAQAKATLAQLFPAKYVAVQRAIITVKRKQFPCDAVLKVSTNEGWHLAVVSSLGLVSEVRVRPDGSSQVLKVTALFPEEWSREFVARDVRALFAPPRKLTSAGWLGDGSLVLESAPDDMGVASRYFFAPDARQLNAIELMKAGRCVYHAEVKGSRAFPGGGGKIPTEFEVDAGAYRLHLRIADLKTPGTLSPSRKPGS